jgi:hypothetical protein
MESGDSRLERSGSGMWKADTLRLQPPPVSVKDRWVGRTSKYWTYWLHIGVMGPVNWCSLFINICLAFNTASIAVLGEKLGGGPADHSVGLGVVSGVLFLESSRVRPTLLIACERLPRMWTARRKRTRGVRGLAWESYVSCISGFPLQGVHQFESPWLSDTRNRLFVTVNT